jgi:hypothetical protein
MNIAILCAISFALGFCFFQFLKALVSYLLYRCLKNMTIEIKKLGGEDGEDLSERKG